MMMIHPWRLMDPVGFLTAQGEFCVVLSADSAKVLVGLWNGKRAIDTITPKTHLLQSRVRLAP